MWQKMSDEDAGAGEDGGPVAAVPLSIEMVGPKLSVLLPVKGPLDFAYTRADLQSMNLSNLEALSKFKYLRSVDASSNGIADVTHLVSQDLQHLSLKSNKLTSLAGLGTKPFLEQLDVSSNLLQSLEGSRRHPKVRKVQVHENQLSENGLDGLHSYFPSVTELSAHHNQIQNIAAIFRCTELKSANLSHNLVTSLLAVVPTPPSCPSLQELVLANNKLSSLASFSKANVLMPSLIKLDLSENGIESLLELQHLEPIGSSLRELKMAGNPVAELPTYKSDVLIHLPLLKVLDGEKITEEDIAAKNELIAQREAERNQKEEEERQKRAEEEEEERRRKAEEAAREAAAAEQVSAE